MHSLRLPAALPAVLLSFPVHAADPVDTVVVSAARIPIALSAAGNSVSVIDRAEIEQRQQIFAADLLTLTPGISISRSGSAGSQTQIRLRGAESNQVLVFIDGIQANDPAGNDEFLIEHLTSFDIERIEIVRGPQSALWGSDALSGVINIITRQPDAHLEAEAFAEGGAFDTMHAGARIAGPLAGPLQAGISVSRFESDGTNSSRTGSEKDGYENTTASLNLRMTPADSLSLTLTGRITDARKAFDATDFLVTGLPADSASRPESDLRAAWVGTGLALTPEGSAWSHVLRATWAGSDASNTEVDDSNRRFETNAVEAQRYGIQYQLTWRDAADVTALTVGVDQEWQRFDQSGFASPFGDPNQSQRMGTTAAVAELRLNPTRHLHLSVGGRYDDNSDFEDVTTFRTTAAWELPRFGTRLRTSLGSGHKSPTFIERFGFFPDQFVGNPLLEPEEALGWEAGIDQALLEGRLRLAGTYFRERLDNEINGFVFDPDLGAATAENLPGKSRRHGVEFSAEADLAASLELSASYTYTDATQPDALEPDGRRREIRRPPHSGSLHLLWKFPDGRGNVDASFAFVGDRTDDFFEVMPPFGQQQVELDRYTLATIAASWNVSPAVTLYGRIENAFDSTYEDVLGYATPGLGAYVGFRARLGP